MDSSIANKNTKNGVTKKKVFENQKMNGTGSTLITTKE